MMTAALATPPDPDLLLSRLERVRRAGRGWSARCPAHQDRSASLSVAVADDGRILVHCFALCPVADVLGAVGLQMSDLFPRRLADASPQARRELREAARQAQWRAALAMLAFEGRIIAIAAYAALRGELSDTDAHRVAIAAERVDDALATLTAREAHRPC
jgi:hypothetical protein